MAAILVNDLFLNNNSYLDIYVIGYGSMGESIVVNLDDKFVGVIDCFKKGNSFFTEEILNKIGKQKVDFMCWTHPDYDHTNGFDKLFKYVDKDETVFIIPEGISAKEILANVEYNEESIHNQFIKLLTLIRENIRDYNLISANQGTEVYRFALKAIGEDTEAIFSLSSFTPISSMVRDLTLNNIEKIIKDTKLDRESNIFSIGLNINVQYKGENIKILLNSDIEDETINKMKPKNREFIFNDTHIFKIPHHCSTTTEGLIINNTIKNIDFACTTSYSKHSLPNEDLLKRYCRLCENIIVSRTDNQDGDSGYIHYRIPIFNRDFEKTSVNYSGAAGEYKITQ